MMNNLRYQAGLTMTGWLLTIVLAGFFMLCAFKMVPSYAEDRYIKTALRALPRGPELAEISNNEIKTKLNKFYTVNNVRSEGASNIDIERSSKKTVVNINYEVRVPLIYNIDVVMTFKNQLDSSKPDSCCKPESD